jgi:hypothetical protein
MTGCPLRPPSGSATTAPVAPRRRKWQPPPSGAKEPRSPLGARDRFAVENRTHNGMGRAGANADRVFRTGAWLERDGRV